jgi:hypothetical protein
MRFDRFAGAVFKGIAAGAVGTAAITALQMLEMKLRDREPSTVPAEAVEKVLDVEPKSKGSEERLANVTHFAYGTSWGSVLGAARAVGLGPIAAATTLFATIWAAALAMLPAMRLAPKPTEWGAGELALDAARHAVYAGAVAATYELMTDR